jgi:hypothetical protein
MAGLDGAPRALACGEPRPGQFGHCEERSDEAIQCGASALDCFASLAMTGIAGTSQVMTTESESN